MIKVTQEYMAEHEEEILAFARQLIPESEWKPEIVLPTIPLEVEQKSTTGPPEPEVEENKTEKTTEANDAKDNI